MYDDDNGGGVAGKIILCSVVALCAFGALIYFFVLKKPTAAIAAPTKYAAYSASDKAFACLAPDGWTRVQSGGGGMMSGVDFTNGGAKVDINSDLQGSLMADISRGPSMPELPTGMTMSPAMQAEMKEAARPAVEKLHIAGKGHVGEEIKEYEEQPMRTVSPPIGEGRCSEWSGDSASWGGGKLHGYRATFLTGERRVTFVCRCPESSWKALQPAFDKMLAGLAPGGG